MKLVFKVDNNEFINKKINLTNVYKRLFCDESGKITELTKKFLDDLYKHAHYFQHDTTDPNKLLIYEGSREIVSYIVNVMNTSELEIIRNYSEKKVR